MEVCGQLHKVHGCIIATLSFRNSRGVNHTIELLLSGDYEFLCHLYGLSGASGMVWIVG